MARIALVGAPTWLVERLAWDNETMELAATGGRSAGDCIARAVAAGADMAVVEASCLATPEDALYLACEAAQTAVSSSRCTVAVHATGREGGLDRILRAMVTYGGAQAVAVDSMLPDSAEYLSGAAASRPSPLETSSWVAPADRMPEVAVPKRARPLAPLRQQETTSARARRRGLPARLARR